MICPRCQRYIHQAVERCPVCGHSFGGVEPTASSDGPTLTMPDPAPLVAGTSVPALLAAPAPTGAAPGEAAAQAVRPHPIQAPLMLAPASGSTTAPALRYALPPHLLEGEIVEAGAPYAYEPRDINRTAALLAMLAMFEVVAIVMFISAYLAVFALIVLILAGFLFGPFAGAARGCLMSAIGLPFRLIAVAWRPVRSALALDQGDERPVREYIIHTASGARADFVVKGAVLPRDIEPGDYVRVAVAERNGRRYARQGQRRDRVTGYWGPLQLEQPPSSAPWVFALVVPTGLLLYLLGTFTSR